MDGMSLEESLSGVDSSLFRLFRQKTSDLQYPKLEKDQYVARWLKARSWDVEKAEKMFRMHLQWRNEVKLDELLATFKMPEVVEKYFPGGICGQDKFGRPTFICPAGTADVFGLMRSASRTQLALSRYYVMEKIVEEILPAQSQKMGRPIDQLVIIFDLQHMNRRQLWRPWLNFVLEMTSIFEVNFPELMAVCFVLNAPSFFSMIFSLLKPILSKETQDKIHYQDESLRSIENLFLDGDLEIKGRLNFLPAVSKINIILYSQNRGNFSNSFMAVQPHCPLPHTQIQMLLVRPALQMLLSRCRFWSLSFPFVPCFPPFLFLCLLFRA